MSDHEPAHADTPAEPGEWLRLPDAAMRLHINLRTVHAWTNDGRLSKRKLPRGRTEVWVPEHMVPDEAPESPQVSTQGTSLATMSQHMVLLERQGEIAAQQMAPLVEELARTRAQMAEQAEHMAAQAEELGRLREVERELTAELERLAPPDEVPDGRPWWRFWT